VDKSSPLCESAAVKPEDDIAASLLVKDETAAALVAQAELLLIELESVQDDDAVAQPVSDRSPLAAPDASAPETNAAVPNLNELPMPAELITALPNELIMTVEAPFADPKSEDTQLPLISKDSGINETCSAAPECAARVLSAAQPAAVLKRSVAAEPKPAFNAHVRPARNLKVPIETTVRLYPLVLSFCLSCPFCRNLDASKPLLLISHSFSPPFLFAPFLTHFSLSALFLPIPFVLPFFFFFAFRPSPTRQTTPSWAHRTIFMNTIKCYESHQWISRHPDVVRSRSEAGEAACAISFAHGLG
jgi:hypothetical protein